MAITASPGRHTAAAANDGDRDEFHATIQYLDCMTGFWSPEYRTGLLVGDYRS